MKNPVISIVLGSQSDLETVQPCQDILKEFDVGYELKILSAHRQPKALVKYVESVSGKGIKIFIAAAGMAAALPGVIAAHTILPVVGVPAESKSLKGMDSLLSIVQMPGGVPVACMAIGRSGAKNSAIFALQVLALSDRNIRNKFLNYKKKLAKVTALKHK